MRRTGGSGGGGRTARRAPSRLPVRYDLNVRRLTKHERRAAKARLKAHAARAGHTQAYVGQPDPGLHEFGRETQTAAVAWFKPTLQSGAVVIWNTLR
jgi:hypothetical protein